MENVMNVQHHLLLNALFQNQLRMFDKHEVKTFLKSHQLYPKINHKMCMLNLKDNNLLIDNVQDML